MRPSLDAVAKVRPLGANAALPAPIALSDNWVFTAPPVAASQIATWSVGLLANGFSDQVATNRPSGEKARPFAEFI